MKNTSGKLALFFAMTLFAALSVACKKEKAVVPAENTTVVETQTPAPVEIASDSELVTNVKDATKDFPGVTATVNNGEIILTGEISRDRLQPLMQSLHALNPKSITNNLKIN